MAKGNESRAVCLVTNVIELNFYSLTGTVLLANSLLIVETILFVL